MIYRDECMENPMKYNIHIRAREKFIVPEINGGRDIDVGCGLGYFSSLLSKKFNVFGVDLDKEALQYLEKYHSGEYVCGDGNYLPFKDSIFDFVLSSEVIEHMPDDKIFLKEIKRILKNNAVLLLTAPTDEGILTRSELCHSERFQKHYKKNYSEKEIISLLKSFDFEIEKIGYCIAFFSRITMEMLKLSYHLVSKKYEKQSDVFKVSDSLIFKIYKFIFPIFLLLNYVDGILAKFIKGDCIMIKAVNSK